MDALAQPRSDGLLTDQQLCNSISYVVAGKSVSASCFTNSVSRLHPKEWASGTAAGVAAAVMSALDLSSEQNIRSGDGARVPSLCCSIYGAAVCKRRVRCMHAGSRVKS
jgi:hypothetical protein